MQCSVVVSLCCSSFVVRVRRVQQCSAVVLMVRSVGSVVVGVVVSRDFEWGCRSVVQCRVVLQQCCVLVVLQRRCNVALCSRVVVQLQYCSRRSDSVVSWSGNVVCVWGGGGENSSSSRKLVGVQQCVQYTTTSQSQYRVVSSDGSC